MSSLPSGWIEPAISEVAEVNPRKDVDLSTSDLVSFVPMAAVDEVSGTILSPVDRPYGEVSKGFTHFRDDDVIFAKITPSMENGKSAVARGLTNGTGMGSTEFHVFRSNGAIEPEYLWRFIRQKSFRENAQAVMSGAVGQQRVPADYLKKHLIPLPPLPEQGRIVAKVDGLTARTARARKELDRIPTLIARYKQRLLALAFSGELTAAWRKANPGSPAIVRTLTGIDGRSADLGDIPQGWNWTSFGDMATVTGGLTKNKSRDNIKNLVPYLRVGNVYANELRLNDLAEIGCTAAEFEKTRLRAGDLLIVEGNGSIEQLGRVAIWNNEVAGCSHQNHIIRARPNAELLPSYGLFWLLSPGGRAAIEGVASSSSGLHTLSITKVKGFPIPVCQLEEQAEIVRRIESAFGWLDRMAADQAAAARLLPKLDSAILAKAFLGKLVPQDPNDEPAAKLLERIKAEREAQGSKPKGGRRRKPNGLKAEGMTEKTQAPRDRLLKDSEQWPGVGLPFEAIAMRNAMPHDTLRDALFELLSGPSPVLQQRFDTDAEVMVIQRIAA